MSKINTHYLGLELSSPIIAGSSNFTSNINSISEAEAAGAGAVVLKSLFEEQIVNQAYASVPDSNYPEADDYLAWYTRNHSVDNYLDLISTARKAVKIPVIASINCYSGEGWLDFAHKVEKAGASALELNVFFLPTDMHQTGANAEKLYLNLVAELKKKLTIPVCVKISHRFTNILNMAYQLHNHGAEGIVMFSRYYEPDFDIKNLKVVAAPVLTNPVEKRYVLRWVGMVSALNIELAISASTGVYTGEDAIKYILAGADTVQVCSALYKKGFSVITEINDTLRKWMDDKEFSTLRQFRGLLNYRNVENPSVFERSQFMKHYSSFI
jgi:dihydroorotate dehydrogenase (fumarate)